MSELMTLVCAAQRDSQQMEILLRKFEPLVRKYARRIHKLEIDDAMQEMSLAFLQLIRKMDLSKFSGPDADKLFLAYLRRAVETRFLDIVKQQENTMIIAFDEVANQDQEDESLSPQTLADHSPTNLSLGHPHRPSAAQIPSSKSHQI